MVIRFVSFILSFFLLAGILSACATEALLPSASEPLEPAEQPTNQSPPLESPQPITIEQCEPSPALADELIIPPETPEQTAVREAFTAFLTDSLHALYNGKNVLMKELLDSGAVEFGFAASHGSRFPVLLIQSYEYNTDNDDYSVWNFRYDNGDIIAWRDSLAAQNGIKKDGSYHAFHSPGMGYIYDGNANEDFTYDQTNFDVYLVDGISVSREEFYALREEFHAKESVDWMSFYYWSRDEMENVLYAPDELIGHIEDEWYTFLLFLRGENEASPQDERFSGYLPTIADSRGGRAFAYDFDSDEAGFIVTPYSIYEEFLNSMGGSYGYALEYLHFEGVAGARAINEYFEERRLEYHQHYTSNNYYFEGPWNGMGEWEAFDPVCVITGMVSVSSEYDGWAGGVGWGRSFGGVVFDLYTGEVLSAGDIFGEDDAIIRKLICDYIADYTTRHPGEYWGFTEPGSEDFEAINVFEFFLVEDALVACYDRYDLGRAGWQGGCIIPVPFSLIGEPKARAE